MSNIEVLKEQARRHEQKEEWRKALDLYQRAIHRLAEEDAPDIGLYNRVGDLFTRVGEVDEAVRAFEQAVELYVESELPNNAIAVCKKILRNVPDRNAVFLRMGQIRAEQGFLVDARTHFLTYAERTQAIGELDEALRALVEFADAAPDDTEIRLAIAGHFQQHERVDEAVDQLVEGYRSAVRQGLDDEVAVFAERLGELRPGVDPEELVRQREGAAAPDLDDTLGLSDESGLELSPAGGGSGSWDFGDAQPLDAEPEPVSETTGADHAAEALEDAAGEAAVEAAPLGDAMDDAISTIGPDVSAFGRVKDETNPLAGFDVVEPEDDFVDHLADDPVGELVDDLAGDPVDESAGSLDDEAVDLFGEDDDDAPLPLTSYHDADDPSPTASDWDDDDDDEAVELPFLHVPASVPADSSGDEGGDAPVEAPDEAGDDEPTGDDPDAPWAEAAEDARATLDEAAELAGRIAAAPDDLELRQRAVEMAHRSGDERALIDAYVGLGEALRRSGSEVRAQAVFREALQLDPNHPAAQAALSETPGARRDVAEVASNEDYVDLGAMILGEEDEKTTRFVVAYEEPSGDEQADFAKMLSQFKAKVAENVDASDVKAHHDLGTAYKEMGLLDEAVEEFQAALRASADHLPTYEMLGQTFLERGTPETAVRVLSRALDAPFEVEDELLGIYYCLGRSHEEIGNTEQAVEFYERVFSLDINFADVTERLRSLR